MHGKYKSPRSGENLDTFCHCKRTRMLTNVCFHYKSPRSGENFDIFMQENAQKCIKIWMLVLIINRNFDIFKQENAQKCIKILMLVFIINRRVAAKILTFLCRKI